MLILYQNRFRPRFAVLLGGALLIGSLLINSCASGGAPRESKDPREGGLSSGAVVSGAEGTAPAAFRREEQIPLWRDLPSGVEKIPVLTVELELIDLDGDPEERLLQDTLYRGLKVQDYAEGLVRIQTVEYREMGEEALNNPRLTNSASLNWDYGERTEVLLDSPRLLVIARDRAFYSGGAHPNSDKTYFVFDRDPAAQVRLSDVIREESRSALTQSVNRALRADKKLGAGDSLKKARFLVDNAELSENFFFSFRGMGFHWDPYEIAPYAEGAVEVMVPLEEIETFLSPRGLELIRELRRK
jgi:hypothetical protein